MNRACLVAFAVLSLVLAPCLGVPQPQVLEDFGGAAPDGRPLGWDVSAFGAEATIRHQAEAPGSMAVQYKFTAPNGVIYLLCRSRLRGKPWNLEVTVRGAAHSEVVGVLVREGATGAIHEFRADPPIKETGWATRAIVTKLPAETNRKDWDTLDGGGGLRFEGLTIRRGPDGPDSATIEFDEVLAQCEVEPDQATMVDVVVGRLDGVYLSPETPAAEVLVNNVSGERTNFDVTWSATDQSGQSVGGGSQRVDASPGTLKRLPIQLTPRAPVGFYTFKASARTAKSQRHATARCCVIPPVPEAGRHFGADVDASLGAAEAWHDGLLLSTLRRCGLAAARLTLNWATIEPSPGRGEWQILEHWVTASQRSGLPLVVVAANPPGWALRDGPEAMARSFQRFLDEARRRAGDRVLAWELWREPNSVRFWPPQPQPFAYRNMVIGATPTLKPAESKVLVVNGGLRGLDRGFAGALLMNEPYPVDQLGLAGLPPRQAFPFVTPQKRPSDGLATALTDLATWLKDTGRASIAPWLVEYGVRTSPLDESKVAQAVEAARCSVLARSAGGHLMWHNAMDGDATTDRYGLLRRDLQPKPALAAVAVAAAATAGTKFLGSPKSAAGRSLYAFTGPAGFVAVGWGTGFTVPADVKISDLWGAPRTDTYAQPGGAPLYFTGAGVVKMLQ